MTRMTHTHTSEVFVISIIDPPCEWHRVTRMTGPECAVMCNLNTHTPTHSPDNLESNKEAGGGAQGTQGSSKNCTSRESVSPLSRLIRGFRNKYH